MGNKRRLARLKEHQDKLDREAESDQKKLLAAEKKTKKRERTNSAMDTDMEHEFASPKRRKLREVDDEHTMIDIRGPKELRYQLASHTEVPEISAESVKSTEILQFGHSEEDKAQVAALSMKKAARDKIELAQDLAARELHKQDMEEAKMDQ